MKPLQTEIDDALNKCSEAADEGFSNWPGMSYEQGVEAAIRWMQGEGSNPMED
jgi:hypothetical protein